MRTLFTILRSRIERMLTHTTLEPESCHIVVFFADSDNPKAHANIFFLFLVLVNLNNINFLVLRLCNIRVASSLHGCPFLIGESGLRDDCFRLVGEARVALD
jgi:hypothetical protein